MTSRTRHHEEPEPAPETAAPQPSGRVAPDPEFVGPPEAPQSFEEAEALRRRGIVPGETGGPGPQVPAGPVLDAYGKPLDPQPEPTPPPEPIPAPPTAWDDPPERPE